MLPYVIPVNMPVLFAAVSTLSLPIAIVGFVIGAYVGALNRTGNANLPVALGVVMGALSFIVAELLVRITLVLFIASLVAAVIVYRPTIERTLAIFAETSGKALTTRRFISRGAQITDEFCQRENFINQLPIDGSQRETLRNRNRQLYYQAIDQMGKKYPYLPPDAANGGNEDVEDLFHME